MSSPYDLDARWAAKGDDLYWNGYKVHVTETCDTPDPAPGGGDPDGGDPGRGERPNIIVGVGTTDATVPDAKMTDPIHVVLAARDLLPAEHFLDSGYPSAVLVVDSLRVGGSRWSPRCWPTPPDRPGPVPGTTGPGSPSTSTPSRPPARRARPPPGGTRSPSAAPTRS